MRLVALILCLPTAAHVLSVSVAAQSEFEDRRIERVDISFEGADRDVAAYEQFRGIAVSELGTVYSSVNVRSAIAALYGTNRIVSASVEVEQTGPDGVGLRFIVKRKTIAKRVTVRVGASRGDSVTEQQLLLRLDLLAPGSEVSDRILDQHLDIIQSYLRERGFFDADVSYEVEKLRTETEVNVEFQVTPNAQAKVSGFKIEIPGFDVAGLKELLRLSAGAFFTRERLYDDLDLIRQELKDSEYLAPRIDEPRVVYDGDANAIGISVRVAKGAKVLVSVNSEIERIGKNKMNRLLPIISEGTLDYSAIIAGQRRLENHFQEKGYFFARISPACSVEPALSADDAGEADNGTELLCTSLSGANLEDRTVKVDYFVRPGRRLKLSSIRLKGTDKFSAAEIGNILESQEASLVGLVPYLGYGRGYTSLDLLQKDKLTILALLQDLGYRRARVGITQGVSPAYEDLIITFVVREGIPTRITAVEFEENRQFSSKELSSAIPNLTGVNYSRARARNGVRKISGYYADRGYFDARVSYSIVELPGDPSGGFERVKLVYRIEKEGKPVVINRVLFNGDESTRQAAIYRSIDLRKGNILRQADIFSSEQNLYATDAFDKVEIKTERAGETPNGKTRLVDVIINLEEKKPRLITYGGGYSSDFGLSGFFDIRHFNFLGNLHQAGFQVRVSQREQLFQFDFVNPRFLPDGKQDKTRERYAPLTFSLQYRRDSTVTRFFRSSFDRGTFGIVQRIDDQGNPIDEFGNSAGDPTINRFVVSLETNRTVSRKDRSLIFFRYRFEDVRLFNFESLLIRELLRPDAKIRISGFTTTFVRDTRKDCSKRFELLEIATRGEPGPRCRYNAVDPTDGDYLTAEYRSSFTALGANVGFNRLQVSYNRYFTVPALHHTTFAGRAIVGMANVFANGDRFTNTAFPNLNRSLPISERFFAGGSTSLRGFEFESAGPRLVIVPQGNFRDQRGNIVTLSPFTVPFGGNALAVVNLEARIPFSESLRVVPFYDGGNVFRSVGELFKKSDTVPGDPVSRNLRAVWTNTIGLGFRIKTPVGGAFAIDYGYLLNPPRFIITQPSPPDGIFRPGRGHLHFRFSQAF